MPEFLEPTHFNDLEACLPRDVIQRTGSRYDADSKTYEVDIWGYTYCVDLVNQKIFSKGKGLETYHNFLFLFIIFYLIQAKNMQPMGDWISEKDLPSGPGFFRGPHTIPVDMIIDRVQDDLSVFESLCRALGGTPLDLADRAFKFEITPLVPVAVLYWQGDDDFPSEANILYDRTMIEQLPLDIVFALAVEICNAFKVAEL